MLEFLAFMAIFTLFYLARVLVDRNYRHTEKSFKEFLIVLFLGAIAQVIIKLVE